MKNLLARFEPADVIALCLIAGGIFLKARGADGLVDTFVAAITFYYFGHRIQEYYGTRRQIKQADLGDGPA